MKRLFAIIGAGIVALTNACTYSETGIYYVDPVPGDPPLIAVSTNLDTISDPTVVDSLEVIYDVVIENGEFYQIEAYMHDELFYNSDTVNGSFWLNPELVTEPGVDSIFLYFFYSTNSNSLADIVELEWNMKTLGYAIIFETGGLP